MKQDKWMTWQIAFLVMIVVPNLLHSHPIDAAHARNSALFRAFVCVVGVIGLIAVQILRWHENAAQTARAQTESVAPPPGSR